MNPRYLAVYRFSRPAVSTTHTPLLKIKLYKIKIKNSPEIYFRGVLKSSVNLLFFISYFLASREIFAINSYNIYSACNIRHGNCRLMG